MVDEEKIRNSEKELYVVTYSLSDRKPMVVNVKEVPDGEIADMLMASAYLSAFVGKSWAANIIWTAVG